jgi:hypothetical protein
MALSCRVFRPGSRGPQRKGKLLSFPVSLVLSVCSIEICINRIENHVERWRGPKSLFSEVTDQAASIVFLLL